MGPKGCPGYNVYFQNLIFISATGARILNFLKSKSVDCMVQLNIILDILRIPLTYQSFADIGVL